MPGLRPAGAAAAAEAAAAEAEAAAGGAGLGVALDELGRDANMERRREAAERSARRRGRLQRDLERLQRQDQARWGRPPARPCLRRRRGRPQARPQRRRWSRTWHGAVPPLLWLVRQGRAQPPGEPDAAGVRLPGPGRQRGQERPPTLYTAACQSSLERPVPRCSASTRGCDKKYPGHCRTARRRCWARRRRTSPIRRSAATRASGATWSRPRGPCLRTPATSSARCARSRRAPAAARAAPGVRQPAGGGQASRS